MKFGKEFASQMVQEWQEAYMDYNYLKTILKDVIRFKQRNTVPSPMATTASSSNANSLKRRVSLYRAFSGLTGRYRGSLKKGNNGGNEDESILISSTHDEEDGEGHYQTMFLKASDESGEYELLFFRKLDDELNKVIKFYKQKVHDIMAEADDLSKQMDALIALRIKVENPVIGGAGSDRVSLVSAAVAHPTDGRNPGWSKMEVIQEVEMTKEVSSDEENSVSNGGQSKVATSDKIGVKGFKPASLEVLDHVKINVEPETPVSTMKNIVSSSKSDLSFSKEELRKAEELMTKAFITFYQELKLLKSYCFLNQLAFSKIMKKYDKITLRNASKAYLNMVDNSYLGSSEELNKLMERVEATFIKHFANGNHRRGMRSLRPTTKRERHRVTFAVGLFTGCTLALLVAFGLLAHARNIINSAGATRYMDNIFPLYTFFGFIILHMLMYAGNIYFWRRFRINYAFIFGFKQGTELGYREVLLLSSCLSVLTLAAVLSNLDMEMDERLNNFQTITELIPLALLILVLLIILCPFNIVYRSSRFFLIQCVFHCILASLYKVTLPDFFMADQLTSQVQAFRDFQFYICYYGAGHFRTRNNTCHDSKVFEAFFIAVALIPYWMRFAQCIRRLFEEKHSMHFYNAIKYASVLVAVAMKTMHHLRRQSPDATFWMIIAAATSGFATIITTYWDIVIDWGLLRRNSTNPWLRDKLVIQTKSVYFIAMVLNVLLRLAWMQSVLGFTQTPFFHRAALTAIVACLEIIRRGIWNFFRLENEHLNNVGMYRAFKSVPLPFSYEDDDNERI